MAVAPTVHRTKSGVPLSFYEASGKDEKCEDKARVLGRNSKNRRTIWTQGTVEFLSFLPHIFSALELKSIWLYFKQQSHYLTNLIVTNM